MKIAEMPIEKIQEAIEKWRSEDNLDEMLSNMERRMRVLESIVCMLAEAERFRIEKARKK